MVSRPAFLCCLVDTFFKGHVHNGIYNNTNFLQTECFKFDFFFRESKGTREYLGKLEQFSYLKITPILQWREAFKYLLALNLDDLDLVKKECFTDEKTRIEIAPMDFVNLLLLWWRKMVYLKYVLQKKPCSFFRALSTYLAELGCIFSCITYIIFRPLSLICKFCILQKVLFLAVNFTVLIRAVPMWKTIPLSVENVSNEILLCPKFHFH